MGDLILVLMLGAAAWHGGHQVLGNAEVTARHVKPEVPCACGCQAEERIVGDEERSSCACIMVRTENAFCLDYLGRCAKSTGSTTSTDAKFICYSLIQPPSRFNFRKKTKQKLFT